MKRLTLAFTALAASIISLSAQRLIDLSGRWNFAIDSLCVGVAEGWYTTPLADSVTLPGTTDSNGKGTPNSLTPKLEKPQVLRLTRKHNYVGPAWYSRTINIPVEMAGKTLRLNLERVMWQSRLWVDGQEVGPACESLTTPHRFLLPDGLSEGSHTITLRIDNSKRHEITVDNLAHAYTNDTQVMWNGVLGEMTLEALPEVHMEGVDIYPDINTMRIKAVARLNNLTSEPLPIEITIAATGGKSMTTTATAAPGASTLTMDYPMAEGTRLWSNHDPAVQHLDATLSCRGAQQSITEPFGMRSIAADGKQLMLNGEPIFLRGTLECCIFPLTGTPPTDTAGWAKVFNTAREWGLNHLRFHSWCPPEAAFRMADSLGFCIQVELPQWTLKVGSTPADSAFIYSEFERIARTHGNHPSLCLMTCGNELQSDFNFLNRLTAHMRESDPRRLYSTTTFTFERGHGKHPEPQDQFFITQYTDDGWVRGQGVFDSEPPRFDVDYTSAMGCVDVPLISHEIGQYAVYPRVSEIDKYTGTLLPLNFMAVRDDLERRGLLDNAEAWTQASGRLAALLYKEEIERALKTPGFSGFQLLDLHDFPGQGTALVGLLDAFWDSKGIIEPETWRGFCSDVVILSRHERATYSHGDTLTASLEVANYSGAPLTNAVIDWTLTDATGQIVASGSTAPTTIPSGGNTKIGRLSALMTAADGTTARSLDLRASLRGSDHANQWRTWVYPTLTDADIAGAAGDIVVTASPAAAMNALSRGKRVLLSPTTDSVNGLDGKFVPVFWSPVHFPDQAGPMGIICDPAHPALAAFPTESHTDWQWWDLLKNSRTMVIDSVEGLTPIVSHVDNFANNRRLASIVETRVGNGRLILSSIDLLSPKAKQSAPTRQMLISLLNYMNSDAFNPAASTSAAALEQLFK